MQSLVLLAGYYYKSNNSFSLTKSLSKTKRLNNPYWSLVSCSVCVIPKYIPDDFCSCPLHITPSSDLSQCTNPTTAPILVIPFPVSSSSNLSSRKKSLGLYLNSTSTLTSRYSWKNKSDKIREMVNFRLRLTRILLVDSKSEFIPVFIAEGN